MPDGPAVSPTLERMPYFSGMSTSCPYASEPPVLIETRTISAPSSASFRSSVEATAMSALAAAMILRHSVWAIFSGSGAMSIRWTRAPRNPPVTAKSRTSSGVQL